ncbi:hypothetical protein FRC07_015183 [Ceratobasidium sp. 392]|nr:hypothetical protein FRC07_015183 [Ceratobasidium sp. 392]
MPDHTYARPVKTTSMTISARRELRAREKLIKQGIVPPPEPEKPKEPRRSGLRMKRYTYPDGEAPQVVDPNASKNKAPPQIQIPVPRLPGQDDLPRSDSPECENLSMYLGKVAPIAEASGSTSSIAGLAGPGSANNRARPASPADTEIADAEGYSSEADGEGEEDPNRGWGPQGQDDEGGEGGDDDDDAGDDAKSEGESCEYSKRNQGELEAGPVGNIGGPVVEHGVPSLALSTEIAASSAQSSSPLAAVVTPDLPLAAAAPACFNPPAQLPHPFGPVSVPAEPIFMDIPAEMQDFLLNAKFPLVDDLTPGIFDGWSEQGNPGLALTGLDNIPDLVPTATSQDASSAPPPAQPSSQPGLASAPTDPFRNNVPGLSPSVHAPLLPATSSAPASAVQSLPKPAPRLTGPAVPSYGSLRASIPPRVTGPNSTLRPMPSAPSTPMPHNAHQLRAPLTRSVSHVESPLAVTGSASIAGPVTPVRTSISAPQTSIQTTSVSIRRAQPGFFSRSTTPSVTSTPSHLRRPSVARPRLSPAQRGTAGQASPGIPRPGPGYGLAPNPRPVSTARARSASPRPPNTPLARPVQALPQLRATRSLTPIAPLGSPSLPLPSSHIPAGHLLPPVTPHDGTPAVPDNDDQARTEAPGCYEPATDFDFGEEVQPDSADEVSHPLRVPRYRTPPPLARPQPAFTSLTLTQSAIDNSNGFILPGPVPDHAMWVDLQPLVTMASPTTAEFAITRDREVFLLQQSNKIKNAKANPNAGRIRTAKKVSAYEGDSRKLMAVMKAHIQYQFSTVSPWALPDETVFRQAKEFAAKYATNLAVDELADEELQKSDPAEQFNTNLMIRAVVVVHFHSSRRFGAFCLDEMSEKDDPEVVAELMRMTAAPDSRGIPQALEIADKSPLASYGPSIAAIAFTAIHVYHALERLKTPTDAENEQEQGEKTKDGKKKVKFDEVNYGLKWKEYVRNLAKHPKLGALRSTFLGALQAEYCQIFPREGEPVGSEHMW